MATAKLLGASIKRREDPRFITGKGNYTDDLKLAGMTHAVFVRSPHANAKIRKIDTSKASKVPGVVAIFTGKDMAGVNSLPCGWLLPELKIPPHMPLATDAARYVGDPVAVVIGESQSAASDGASIFGTTHLRPFDARQRQPHQPRPTASRRSSRARGRSARARRGRA